MGCYLPKRRPPKQVRKKQQSSSSKPKEGDRKPIDTNITRGSMLSIATGLLQYEEARTRPEGEKRRKGTISQSLYRDRKHYVQEFLKFLNDRYGEGAVKNLLLSELTLEDVEAYNRELIKAELSSSQVSKRLRYIQSIVNRAGRPEYGSQALAWNWASLDLLHGKPATPRKLPTLKQLKLILKNCDVQRTAIVWLGIACGFGQRDIAAIQPSHFNRKSFDLRRGKTGIERYGSTPNIVWSYLSAYLKTVERKPNDLMFLTSRGHPLVHGNSDAIVQWWARLRERIGKPLADLDGFYILRHLGATEYGSRPNASISDVRKWLGHSASSQIADVYMKQVSPENRAVIEWVRKSIQNGQAMLKS